MHNILWGRFPTCPASFSFSLREMRSEVCSQPPAALYWKFKGSIL